MQLVALDENQNLIQAFEAKSKKDYRCPHCQRILRLKKGFKKQVHFFHLSKNDCLMEGKSLTHISIQQKLQKLFNAAEVEKPFLSIGRIADVCVEDSKLIFEVQCSAISGQEIKQRTSDYQSLGYQVIWIFHLKLFRKNRASFPFYFTDIDERGKGAFFDFFETQWFEVDFSKKFMTIESISSLQIPKNTIYFYQDRIFRFLDESLHITKQSKFEYLLRFFLFKRLQKSLDT